MTKIYLMDIGARWGIQWPWSNIEKSSLSLTMVEPDPEEAARLLEHFKREKQEATILPIALWSDAQKLSLNLTNSPGASSVFEPNALFLRQFPDFDRFCVTKKIELISDSVDNLASANALKRVDFVKIDVQGAELEILRGGKHFFSTNLIGAEVEVEFSELYSGQPLFADIDNFVRTKLGLELWDISKSYWKYNNGSLRHSPTKGRLVFGDALYFRPVSTIGKWLGSMPRELAVSKIQVLVETVLLYGYFDYAYAIVEEKDLDGYLTDQIKGDLIQAIKKFKKGVHFSFKGSGRLYILFLSIANLFRPTYKGWASRGDLQLGSKRKGISWV